MTDEVATPNEEDILKHLSNQKWRLNNLYTIIDKEGTQSIFKFNWAQKELYENIWFSNVILKARQLGISTFVCLFFLDTCLFKPNVAAGIIAHTREDAEHMFKRIKFAYDQLPECVKSVRTATVDSARELVFNNHSSLRVGTSMRGSTLQYLHISEFGKICAHFPDKAREIVTGSLNTLGARQYVFIESTAEGKEGYFYEICKQAESAQLSNKKLSSLDYRFHFYPWFDCPDYNLKETITIPKEIEEYFEKLAQQDIELTQGQKGWYYKKLLTQKDDMKREYPSTPDESFESAIDGSFYAKWIREARFEGRVGNIPWDKQARVSIAFDPGYLDSCAVVFFQCIGQEIHIIDYYENSGEGLSHYLGVIKAKPYIYDKYFGPHDIESHQFSTGLSTKEVGASLGVNFITLQTLKLRLEDGIEAVRGLFPRFWIDEQKCGRLIKCIESYRKEFDHSYQIYKSRPIHDQYSHGCFPAGTLISTSTGNKPIESIQEEDKVQTPTGLKRVLKTFQYEADIFLSIETVNYKFTCTRNHKIFTDRGLIYADALRYNDIVYSIDDKDLCKKFGIPFSERSLGFRERFLLAKRDTDFDGPNSLATNTQKLERVVKVVQQDFKCKLKVYDFEVEDDHCYYANGILVSNSDALRYAAIAIKTYVDSDNSGISDNDADKMWRKYNPHFS